MLDDAVPDVPAVVLDVVPEVDIFAFVNTNELEADELDVVVLVLLEDPLDPCWRQPVTVTLSLSELRDVAVLLVGSCAPATMAPANSIATAPLDHIVHFICISLHASRVQAMFPVAGDFTSTRRASLQRTTRQKCFACCANSRSMDRF